MAELFDDHSPLQLLPAGASLDGKGAALHPDRPPAVQSDAGVDRVGGFWKTAAPPAWARTTAPTSSPARSTPAASCPKPAVFAWGPPPPSTARAMAWPTAAVRSLMSAQGELPQLPPLGQPFDMVELRSRRRGAQHRLRPPAAQRGAGRAVLPRRPPLQGLKDESAKEEKRPAVQLPALRRTVQVQLSATKASPAARQHH